MTMTAMDQAMSQAHTTTATLLLAKVQLKGTILPVTERLKQEERKASLVTPPMERKKTNIYFTLPRCSLALLRTVNPRAWHTQEYVGQSSFSFMLVQNNSGWNVHHRRHASLL
jgi:hypothetical protein